MPHELPTEGQFQAYRREKQKAEGGISDPAETSWKLIKGLRERLQPGQVQSIVKKAGVVAQKASTGNKLIVKKYKINDKNLSTLVK